MNGVLIMIYGIFLHEGVLGSLGYSAHGFEGLGAQGVFWLRAWGLEIQGSGFQVFH